jgi:AMMECR1 domain-containing protein
MVFQFSRRNISKNNIYKEVNVAFQQLCALLEKRKSAMIATIQADMSERIGIFTDMATR